MPNKLAHFAIEADNVERARGFYETVFRWRFEPWGPPNFYLIHNAGVHGALQQRSEPVPTGRKGFDLSFAIDDIDASSKAIVAAGGTLIGERHSIPTVGTLLRFADTESNEAFVIQYEPEHLKDLGL